MSLFLVSIAAAIAFVLAAVVLASRGANAPRRRKHRWSLLADLVAGCRDLGKAACAAFEPRAEHQPLDSRLRGDEWGRGSALADGGRHETVLLPRRMKLLGIDPEALARSEPLLFRSLALRCRQCASPQQCTRELERASPDSIEEGWKDYCMNVALLRMLSAIEGIGATAPVADTSATGDIRH
jgi:hypothetical protein